MMSSRIYLEIKSLKQKFFPCTYLAFLTKYFSSYLYKEIRATTNNHVKEFSNSLQDKTLMMYKVNKLL